MTKKICHKCCYYKIDISENYLAPGNDGWCYRYPPVFVDKRDDHRSNWEIPSVSKNHWCGEFVEKGKDVKIVKMCDPKKELRKKDAMLHKHNDYRAYSDAYNHVIVNMNGQEYGYDVVCAIQLRDSLIAAIANASIQDSEYF